jgi:hypothetical protein
MERGLHKSQYILYFTVDALRCIGALFFLSYITFLLCDFWGEIWMLMRVLVRWPGGEVAEQQVG